MMTAEDFTAQPGLAIVHIGLDKTGTTSIQEFCRYKTEMLRGAGMHYPHPANPAAISHEAFAKAHGFSWNVAASLEDSRNAGEHLAGPLDFLAKLPSLQAENDMIAEKYGVELPPLWERAGAYAAKLDPMAPEAVQGAAMFMLMELISEAAAQR